MTRKVVVFASFLIALPFAVRASFAAAPPTTQPFSTPVWHPEARWESAGPWAGSGVIGHLDGPRQEVQWRRGNVPPCTSPLPVFTNEDSRGLLWGYDPTSQRIHVLAGSTRGLLDGPFSRARFGGSGYVAPVTMAITPDGRYHVQTDPGAGYAVRALDFKEQVVRTIVPPNSGVQALAANSRGQALVLLARGRLLTIDIATGRTVADITLKAADGLSLGMGKGLAFDERHNRLYASGTVVGSDRWHVWYFDLNDGGSFHGVLKGGITGAQPSDAGTVYTGPFDGGYKGYPEHSIYFGPDDPDFRFLYMRVTDTPTFHRLDLEKRMVAACSGPPKGRTAPVMFVEHGRVNPMPTAHVGPMWLSNGDFVLPGNYAGTPAQLYKRIQ